MNGIAVWFIDETAIICKSSFEWSGLMWSVGGSWKLATR